MDVPQSGDQSRKTNVRNLDADESCEYYSETLIRQLHNLDANLDYKHTCRLVGGKYIKSHLKITAERKSEGSKKKYLKKCKKISLPWENSKIGL